MKSQRTAATNNGWDWASVLVEFLTAGYSEDLYWSLTPRQVDAHFLAARKRRRIDRNMMMETAYRAALAPYQTPPTKLDRLLIDIEDSKPKQLQTIEEMISIARSWSAVVNRRK